MSAEAATGLRARWDELSEREKRMVTALGVVAVVLLLGLFAFWSRTTVGEQEDENAEMRRVLKEIDENRDSYQRVKAKAAQVEARLGRGGVQLEGLLETAARETEVEIKELNGRPPVDVANKKYKELAVDLRMPKVTLEKLAHFLRKVETGPNLVVVTSLSARVRDDKHEDLEVEMTATTWERAPDVKKGAGAGAGGAAGGKEGK